MKNSRRDFIEKALKVAAITTVGVPFVNTIGKAAIADNNNTQSATALQFSQVKLPYEYNALEPYIDAQTMELHYSKHHSTYVKNVNEAIAAEKVTAASEKDFFAKAAKLSAKLRNNGGGAWNHNFFWMVMKPGSNNTPSGKALEAINNSFGSFDKFKEQFTQAALNRFGSGWAWLVADGSKLKIGSTPNQDNPLMDVSEIKGTPVLALDVWEHAYYLKYQNKRNEYIANWWNVVNWEEVAKRLA
ncbi:superoxide dismutase [Chryseosolibacter indicus]|uniref:Superoxide dismutase n=1 Tax=Chryseosolibacter indicus TaxID=2782351 RepID=A0ABS5VMG6_9BACT|nr:superoxide dismutase [Chryseosolibacter indicus]MBT1702642.1 superoxide dismutase [Chryseosolibacter indicus]